VSQLSEDLVILLLKRENDLRLSPEIQEKFRVANQVRPDGWLTIVPKVHRQLAKEFDIALAVVQEALMTAEKFVSTDIANDISLYRKYNRCKDGSLEVGDAPPDVSLVRMDGEQTSLHDFMPPLPSLLVVFAGSYT